MQTSYVWISVWMCSTKVVTENRNRMKMNFDMRSNVYYKLHFSDCYFLFHFVECNGQWTDILIWCLLADCLSHAFIETFFLGENMSVFFRIECDSNCLLSNFSQNSVQIALECFCFTLTQIWLLITVDSRKLKANL